MAFYYLGHIRDLEKEAVLENQCLQARLQQEKALWRSRELSNRPQQDIEASAYLKRSRLQAELSANRSKIQHNLPRSRIQSALETRQIGLRRAEEIRQNQIHEQSIFRDRIRYEQEARIKLIMAQEESIRRSVRGQYELEPHLGRWLPYPDYY